MYQSNFDKNNHSNIHPASGRVQSISKLVDSQLAPVDIFEQLSNQLGLTNNMLLESSEIESKENVKSILMLKAALRVECNANQVVIQALTTNGENVIALLAPALKSNPSIKCICHEKSVIAVEVIKTETLVDEDSRLKQPSPLDILRLINSSFSNSSDLQYSVFLCGLFAFDLIATFEALPVVEAGKNTCPDYVFYLAESLIVVDHLKNTKRLISNVFYMNIEDTTKSANYYQLAREFEVIEKAVNTLNPIAAEKRLKTDKENFSTPDADEEIAVVEDLDDEAFESIVSDLKTNIVDGDIFQVVPSRTFSIPCPSPIDSYRNLKQSNPSPYLFFMQDQDFSLFGASPESALKYTSSDNSVLLYPIAGTRPRGKKEDGSIDLDLDARIEAELKLDEKEVAEHMMLVDLARNDIAKISKTGTTHVPRLLAVDRYSQVMHLVSIVKGQLKPELDALSAYLACMNMGTLTGAPKIKASQLIRQVEKQRRGSYGGAVGYLNGNGDMDTCIVIRSAFCKDGIAHIQAGAGVVYDSQPKLEAEETRNKAQAVINAVKSATTNIVALKRPTCAETN